MTKKFVYCDECKQEITEERPLATDKWVELGRIKIRVSVAVLGHKSDNDDEDDEEDDDEVGTDICVPCVTKLLNQRALGVIPKYKVKVPAKPLLRVKTPGRVFASKYHAVKAAGKRPVIKHKNGDPTDNRLTNLEVEER